MTLEDFLKFWEERPAIQRRIFAREAKVAYNTLRNTLDKVSIPSEYTLMKLERACIKYGYNHTKPIKIDEFWLKALGFAWSSMRKGWHISKGGVEILFDKDFGCYIEMVGIDIDYVHELQNLFFAIHKEELEVKKT